MSLFRWDDATREAVMRATLGRRTGFKRLRKPSYTETLERYFPSSTMPSGFKTFRYPKLIKLTTRKPEYSRLFVSATPPDGPPVDPRVTPNCFQQNSRTRPMHVDIPDDQKMARRSNFRSRRRSGIKAVHYPKLIEVATSKPEYSRLDVPAAPPDGPPVDPRITPTCAQQNSRKRSMPVDIPDDQKMARRSNFSRRK